VQANDRPRFWRQVDSGSKHRCWPYTGHVDKDGYGRFNLRGHKERAHRVAYMLAFGPIPRGRVVCHRCDNPRCCNPAHLWAGTQAENIADAARKGRMPGARHSRRLSDKDVAAIRAAYTGKWGQLTELARKYGVTDSYLGKVVRGHKR